MEFSFLEFWVPFFFVLNKTERRATLSLILSEFTDSNLVLFSTLKQILKYELYPSKRLYFHFLYIQSALVISNFKGLSEIHRDTRTSTYQISRIEKKNLTTKFPKFICNLTPLHKIHISKLLSKRGEIAPEEQFLLLSTIFLPVVKFLC